MSEVSFGRTVRFFAYHHYQVPDWSTEQNQQAFGPAAQPHGHDWTLTVWVSGPLDPVTGMMVDLVALDDVLEREVRGRFHGRHFREVDSCFEIHQPTTEVLAGYFAARLQAHLPQVRLVRLRIAEMDDLFAEWRA